MVEHLSGKTLASIPSTARSRSGEEREGEGGERTSFRKDMVVRDLNLSTGEAETSRSL